jgi:putative lipoic acid-binding regulatory protein
MTKTTITFPCEYPIKVVGDVHPDFHEQVYEIVAKHDPTLTIDRVSQRTSRKGNFISISFMLQATSQQQLEDLFSDLKLVESVRLVL